MLSQVTHIEGLDRAVFENTELPEDTKPTAVQVRFFPKAVEMVGESNEKGETIRRNFVFIEKTMDLGQRVVVRRVKDTLKFDEETQTWTVKRLVPGMSGDGKIPRSDIMRYPNEWNAFMRGVGAEPIGAPLSLLFPADPSRVAHYKAKFIHTIEQLSACGSDLAEQLGMGARGDIERAKQFVTRTKEQAPGLAMQAKLDELSRGNAALAAQNADLTAKLTQLLQDRSDDTKPGKPGRKPKTETLEA